MKTKDYMLISLFTALTAIGAFLNIPTPTVPFSLQFLFCAYSGVLLGSKRALISQALYVAIGLIGVPVFTKGGGFGYIFEPSFGFVLGFIPCAFIIGFTLERVKRKSVLSIFLASMLGLSALYIIGSLYLYMILNIGTGLSGKITLLKAFSLGVAPYVLFDLLKVLVVAITGSKLKSLDKIFSS